MRSGLFVQPPSGPDPKRRYDLDSLTDVALRVFARKGYDGASMDDVAAEAGITKAAIYHHVSGKEALLARGLGRALDALYAVLEEDGACGGRAVERLRYIVRRVTELVTTHLAELAVLIRVRGNSPAEREALERRRGFDHTIAGIVAEAQREGGLRADLDPRLVARLVFGMANSLVEWYRPAGALSRDAIVGALVAMVFTGLEPE